MGKSFSAVFVSNYINHHQIPFCNAMSSLLQGRFTFIQTEPMEEDRVKMGWHAQERPEYVRCFYEEEDFCRRLILDCDILLFGGTDEESYISGRLRMGRPIIRISERLYKTGQWKAVSPRGLRKKYRDHTRYRRSRVYLLCAGAYVASDFHIVRAYPKKMYCWGYFPEVRYYDGEELWQNKGYEPDGALCSPGEPVRRPSLLWAGRMIDWKHPELALETARYLREKGLAFHMDIIGDGERRSEMEKLCENYELQENISFRGYQPPEVVRRYMEKADIYLFTSDRQEGWGAVANEAMNSGCALVIGHMIGAAPFLIENGWNGFLYEDGKPEQLYALAEKLVKDRVLCRQLGRNAYETITRVWNGENAAKRLTALMEKILQEYAADLEGEKVRDSKAGENREPLMRGSRSAGREMSIQNSKSDAEDRLMYEPCMSAPVLQERSVRKAVRKQWKEGLGKAGAIEI